MKRALKYFRTQISSGTDPMTIINEILQTIAVKNSKVGETGDTVEKLGGKIEKLEDKTSAAEGEIYDLNALLDETLLPLAKTWYEKLKQDFPKFGATILEDNTTIRLRVPINGEHILAQIELSVQNHCRYELTSCDGSHNRDMYFLLKDIIPNPTPQQSTYGYGTVELSKAYNVFTDLITKLESL